MECRLFNNETEDLINLMTKTTWKYHFNTIVTEEKVKQLVDSGYYQNGRETYWILNENETKVGILIIEDIEDTILSFDLRFDQKYQGKGYGIKTLQWLQEYLFGEKGKIRIEGYTRVDNIAMRKCFTKAGFVKEGYLRNAWENKDGSVSDSILYSAINSDWKSGKTTPIRINDVPY